jgi:amino acid transporter
MLQDRSRQLKRTLGLPAVLLFGLAYMTPVIVYGTYGVLAKASQDTAALSYAVALVAILFTALSYCKLARQFPVAGSAYSYTRKAFNGYLGFLVGWATLLDYFFIPMVIWLVGAAYMNAGWPAVPSWIWVLGFIVVTSTLNIRGIELAARLNLVLMAAQLAVVALFMFLCWRYAAAIAGPGGVAYAEPVIKPQVPFSAVLAGAAIAAYSYLGFDAVSTLTEETVEPKKNMPRAILGIALIGGVIFILASYTTQLAHPGTTFEHTDAAAVEIARAVGGNIFMGGFFVGTVLATFAAGISAQASAGRLLFAMGRDGVLPERVFGYLHPKYRTPAMNIAFTGAVGLLALTLDVATSTSFINFGAFLAFTAVNLCVVRQYLAGRFDKGSVGFIGGLLVPIAGAVADIWLLTSLERAALILGVAWFLIGIGYLCWITRLFRRPPPEVALV